MRRRYKIVLLVILIILCGVWGLVRLPNPLFPAGYSTVVLDEEDRFLRVFLNENEQWALPPVDDAIPHKLKQAVIYFEDKRFYYHPGIDPVAVGRAIIQNIKSGTIISGASTITMQVARLSRSRERTLFNKFIEMIQAIKLELYYSKEEILGLYLTHAPYGGNIVGYRTASYRYFGKSPAEITWSQAATLAVLPNSPTLINPDTDSSKLKEKRNRLLQKLLEKKIINKKTYLLAIAEEIPRGQFAFPLQAPHLAEKLKYEYPGQVIKTTIDREIQSGINKIVSNYMSGLKERGIHNCAVLVVETKTREVKTYIGSNNYFDKEHGGNVDGVQMARSSGSILKPFLYGLAMDDGLIVPRSLLKDIPVNYGGYTPYNFNGKFEGVVRAKKALINSLNAPAVSLLDIYGVDKFYNFLKKAGVTTLFRTPDEYGLPLILGGAETSLWDLATLYTGLGNYGSFKKQKLVNRILNPEELNMNSFTNKQDNYSNYQQSKIQLISSGSSFLVLDILKELKRPGLEYFWEEYGSLDKIAWKTGTSYGHRDAWTIGVSPQWMIAVWTGNFNGEENKFLTGQEAAAPLFFHIFNYLNSFKPGEWFPEPASLKNIKISSKTGYRLPEKALRMTDDLVKVKVSASAKPLRYSPYEKIIYVNKNEREQVCSRCWQTGNYKKIFRLVYPQEVIYYLKQKRGIYYSLPPHRASCPAISDENPIKFIYPGEGSTIFIPTGIDGKPQKIKFKIGHSYQNSILYWYLNQEYLGQTNNIHQKLITLASGKHNLHIVDNHGNHAGVNFFVER